MDQNSNTAQTTFLNVWITFKVMAFIMGVLWIGRNAYDWYFELERPAMSQQAFYSMVRDGAIQLASDQSSKHK